MASKVNCSYASSSFSFISLKFLGSAAAVASVGDGHNNNINNRKDQQYASPEGKGTSDGRTLPSEGDGVSSPPSPYYPYTMDRLDDAMSEIPFDEFHDLWKFIEDEEDGEDEDVRVAGTSGVGVGDPLLLLHPEDSVKRNQVEETNRRRDTTDTAGKRDEQLIHHPRSVKTLAGNSPVLPGLANRNTKARLRNNNNNNSPLPPNPTLAQVLGISLE